MGVSSNVEVFLSEKHVTDHKMDLDSTLFQEKPITETLDKDCIIPTHERYEVRTQPQEKVQERDREQESKEVQERDQEQESKEVQERDQERKEVHACLNQRLKIPPYKNDQEDSYDGFKTPISKEQKIPTILQCPPAPRKRKMMSSTEETKGFYPRVLDFTRLSMDLDIAVTNKKLRNLFMGA